MLARMLAHGRRCAVIQFIKSGSDAVEKLLRGPLPREAAWARWIHLGHAGSRRGHQELPGGVEAGAGLPGVTRGGLPPSRRTERGSRLQLPSEGGGARGAPRKAADQHVVVTGRNACPEIVELADLVTEMKEIKHPFKAGVKAQPGIEL